MPPVRVAILADDPDRFRAWELRLFERICSDPRFALVGLVSDGRPRTEARGGLYGWMAGLEERAFAAMPRPDTPAFDAARASARHISVSPSRSGGRDRFSEADADAIRNLGAHVLLQHGFDIPDGRVLDAARFGIWSLAIGANGLDRGPAAGFRETMSRAPVTEVTLWQFGHEAPRGRPIARAAFNTQPLAARNRVQNAEKAVPVIWRALEHLAERGTVDPLSNDEPIEPATPLPRASDCAAYAVRTGGVLAEAAFARAARFAGRRTKMWSLFFGRQPFGVAALASAREVVPSPGEFWADPFLFVHGGRTYVFYENYVYATGRGKISVGLYGGGDRFDVLGDALDLPYHLSYPFVFAHEGEILMIPESSAARCIEVWRAVDFPLRWERVAKALDGISAADTVLFEDGGQWWMATNISDDPFSDHCTALHLFSIDGPRLASVEAHALNPVVLDSRTARNGGRIVRRDGKLIRASQNNSHGVYGWGLNLMEITRLDRDSYEERRILAIEPTFKKGIIACHHVDMAGDIFVVDGCRNFG